MSTIILDLRATNWDEMCTKRIVAVAESRKQKAHNREIKIHVYRKRQNSDSSWEFLRIENKQIKTVQHDSYG